MWKCQRHNEGTVFLCKQLNRKIREEANHYNGVWLDYSPNFIPTRRNKVIKEDAIVAYLISSFLDYENHCSVCKYTHTSWLYTSDVQ